jgi:hypothetical protein
MAPVSQIALLLTNSINIVEPIFEPKDLQRDYKNVLENVIKA